MGGDPSTNEHYVGTIVGSIFRGILHSDSQLVIDQFLGARHVGSFCRLMRVGNKKAWQSSEKYVEDVLSRWMII